MVYRLTNGLVLKLCETKDQEPSLFQDLETMGIYPKLHASNNCIIRSSAGQPAGTWQAWLCDYAKPLDQILQEFPTASDICIPGAIRAMLLAHTRNHILSDNALFNFGMLHGSVVIIDAGSRSQQQYAGGGWTKGAFNQTCMLKFWSKAQALVHPEKLNVYKEQWRTAWNMSEALQRFENMWEQLRSAEQSAAVLDSLEVPNSPVLNSLQVPSVSPSTCPHVAALLDSIDTDTFDWLTQEYLWGKVAHYGPSSDGCYRQQDNRTYTAAEKLEHFITETHTRRVAHCENPDDHICTESELDVILHEWKEDYNQWMRPESLEATWTMTWTQWHSTLRRRFRSQLFQFVGSYEMAVFFLVAPFNADNLFTFRYFSVKAERDIENKKKQNTRALEWSKSHVRAQYTRGP